jgi:thioredoxin-like negative regulator of GroEL
VYKKIWDADRPTEPLPGRATGMTKLDPADPVAVAAAESAKSTDAIAEFFNGLKTALAYARDGMRSRFAVATVKSLAGQVDGLKELVDKLPATEKTKALALVREQLAQAKAEADTTLAIRGVGNQLKPIVGPMFEKLDAMTK